MVELDVADDRDVRQVFQELRGLVEERAVVFVAFDDEVAAAARADSWRRLRSCAAMPPTSTLGSAPPCVSSHPVSAVVVVFPCVPAMTTDGVPEEMSRIASGSEQ